MTGIATLLLWSTAVTTAAYANTVDINAGENYYKALRASCHGVKGMVMELQGKLLQVDLPTLMTV